MHLQWELMVFTLFVCLSAGVFAVQGILAFLGKGEKIQLPALAVSLVSLGIGGVGSFLHLEHWERIFNGFGHLTSGITQELIAIAVFVVALVVYFVMLRKSEDGKPPKWCGIMALVLAIALVVVMAHSYNMVARPVWNTPLLWLYYLVNAAFYGALGVAAIAGIKRDASVSVAAKLALVAGIVQVLATAAYVGVFMMAADSFTEIGNHFDPTLPNRAMVDPASIFNGIYAGENAVLFWLGVVVLGLLVPVALAVVAQKKEGGAAAGFAGGALVCALAGGMCFRVILYILGLSVFMFY